MSSFISRIVSCLLLGFFSGFAVLRKSNRNNKKERMIRSFLKKMMCCCYEA